ncbi:hypothetical protein XBO1_2060031 [Xenorhabdus bovienii str. oregonense]|uniref:Uncharacterized protein n=2 Tax=Xenorhabdus bovienii TaxID=40576 RepID=A0A077P491_XENBV|nr:hypothetical protein XBO1_2060031 [Xenorhabdus bovienii str. oregonense]
MEIVNKTSLTWYITKLVTLYFFIKFIIKFFLYFIESCYCIYDFN